MQIEAIVFDMDDTLYKEQDYVISGMKEIDKWLREKYGIDGFYGIAMMLINSGEKKLIFNKALERLKVRFEEKFIIELIEKYRNHEPDIHLLDDAKWVFNHLIDTVKLGLITDGFLISQERKVKALNLRERFHCMILTDKWGRENWKPSPMPYQQVSKELKVAHEHCVYIGDNVRKDFITAKKLGWITVQIEREDGIYSNIKMGEEYDAHYKISNLRALRSIPILESVFKREKSGIDEEVSLC